MPVGGRLRAATVAWAVLLLSAGNRAQSGRIQGFVRDETGRPIKAATVLAENPNATPSSFKAVTDDKGRWAMIGLRGGNWTFKASAPGFQTTGGTGRIETIGTNPNLEFTLVKASSEAAAPPAGADTRSVDAGVASADALMEAGRYDEAVDAYESLLAAAPASTHLGLRLGHAYRLRRDYDKALATLRRIPAGDPAAGEAVREIGLTYLDMGDLGQADDVLSQAASQPSPSREVLYALGEVTFARNQPEQAAHWYRRAAAADPRWARPLLKLGLVAVNRGDKAEATKYLEQAIVAEPGSPEAIQARTILDQLK
jgi:Flp pilus assembly protein TadD